MDFEHSYREFSLAHLPAVPKESVEGWKEKSILGKKQELVALGAFTDFSDCDTSAVYAGERGSGPEMNFTGQAANFTGKRVSRYNSLLTHFVRKDVFDRLVEAQKGLSKLAPGYYFKFYDGYRPLAVQQELWDVQREKIKKQHPEWNEDEGSAEQKAEAKKSIDEATHFYIAKPAEREDLEARTKHPAPHTTGAAIDLRLIKLSGEGLKRLKALEDKKQSGALRQTDGIDEKTYQEIEAWVKQQSLPQEKKVNWLEEYRYGVQKSLIFREHSELVDTGTGFDDFSPAAAAAYYETIPDNKLSDEDRKRRDNRRLLYTVMNDVGFLSYPGEWWHFSYGDQEWAANKGKEAALFGEADVSEENRAMETARRLVYLKTIKSIKAGENPMFVEEAV